MRGCLYTKTIPAVQLPEHAGVCRPPLEPYVPGEHGIVEIEPSGQYEPDEHGVGVDAPAKQK